MMSDGGAAFNLMGDWVYRYFADADPNGLGLTPHVDFDWANSPGTYGIFVFLSDGFVLPANAQHPDAATAWLTVVASRAGQEAFNPYKGSICPRTDCDLSLFNEYSQEAASDWISNVLVGSLQHGVVASPDWLASISAAIEVFQTDPTKTSEFRAALVAACQADGTCP
jgi:glucose/mannose transport system substrate-binding protein